MGLAMANFALAGMKAADLPGVERPRGAAPMHLAPEGKVPSSQENGIGWCGREDSNFHGLSATTTSTLRVYQFRHDRTPIRIPAGRDAGRRVPVAKRFAGRNGHVEKYPVPVGGVGRRGQ
jgi:hypothetical protein